MKFLYGIRASLKSLLKSGETTTTDNKELQCHLSSKNFYKASTDTDNKRTVLNIPSHNRDTVSNRKGSNQLSNSQGLDPGQLVNLEETSSEATQQLKATRDV
jgi:hypothetical protein